MEMEVHKYLFVNALLFRIKTLYNVACFYPTIVVLIRLNVDELCESD